MTTNKQKTVEEIWDSSGYAYFILLDSPAIKRKEPIFAGEVKYIWNLK